MDPYGYIVNAKLCLLGARKSSSGTREARE